MAPVNRSSTRLFTNTKKPTISAENIIAGNSISFSKRKADTSPSKNGDFKRLALNEITNDGKSAKIKNLIKNGKSVKSNIEVSVDKPTVKSKVSVPETRSKATKLVSGVRIQGPFKGRSNINSHPYQNGALLKNNDVLKSKDITKPLPRPSIVTRASLCSKSNVEKPKKNIKNSTGKGILETCKTRSNSSVTRNENQNSVDPSTLLLKLKLRSSTAHSVLEEEGISKGTSVQTAVKNYVEKNENSVSQNESITNETSTRRRLRNHVEVNEISMSQNENTSNENSIRRSLRNHIEKKEISVQSLIPVFEPKKENEPLVPSESNCALKPRRSLRNITNKTETTYQIVENKVECEINDPSGVNLRRSSRIIAKKSGILPEVTDKNQILEKKAEEKNEELVPVLKLRKSLRNTVDKEEIPFQVYVENHSSESEPKVQRRSSRLSLRKSLISDKSTENGSLYVSALEEINSSFKEQENDRKKKRYADLSEFDKELLHDPQQVSLYAMEIFDYLKSREAHFPILDYMDKQPHIDRKMRAMLVDWMVEVQENFELNHETLYLSVKLLDMYLSHNEVRRESLQLLGAAALFLSCKYDERLSPLTEEFEYVGDGAYDKTRLLTMEQNILKCVNYELSFPISYSFLRRYARCARIQMPLLTLARYILEIGLMEYDTITLSDSKQAAAALYLAFQMVKHSNWTDSLRYYTGYDVEDFKDIVLLFNRILHQKPASHLMTIRNKYSHELFYKVAETPLLSNKDLNLDV